MFNFIIARIRYLLSPKKRFYKIINRYLGIFPSKITYYELAFLHRSASIINTDGSVVNNERLEFLGDTMLDAVIGEFLYYKFPKADEGFLTQMRSKIVNGERLSELARKMKLSKLIVTNTTQNISKKHIYEDAFEAFIGAIYLDKGFYGVKKYVIGHLLKKYVDVDSLVNINTNYKSQLIEWAQKYKRELEFYTDLETPNSRYFISYVRIDRETVCSGTGLSKKEAEQKAAKIALQKIELNQI